MTETRANLIFLAAVLALVAPGVFILFNKKLEGPGRSTMPPATRNAAAFMDPTPGGLPMQRYVPAMVGSFVTGLARHNARSPGLVSLVEGQTWQAVTSERRNLQLVAHDPSPGANKYCLIIWFDRPVPIESMYTWSAVLPSGEKVPAQIEALHTINLPPDLREELQTAGYIRPPAVIAWTQVKFTAPEKAVSLEFNFKAGENNRIDRIDLTSINSTTPMTRP